MVSSMALQNNDMEILKQEQFERRREDLIREPRVLLPLKPLGLSLDGLYYFGPDEPHLNL
ncbi:18192_t:CDS:2 [Gigaspora margarita]|uniref:18192_t:CDS:1 n=1 Tax=Gigaspora margarita TaxID=4874 RepID=A0ABM8VY44_GIGMA|nr:18192_t:CDS:2 [Gigaspora margarita]